MDISFVFILWRFLPGWNEIKLLIMWCHKRHAALSVHRETYKWTHFQIYNIWTKCLGFSSDLNNLTLVSRRGGVHAQLLLSCLTLCDPVDCSLSCSSVHGDSPGKNTGVGCHFLLQGIFLAQDSNLSLLGLLLWQAGSLPLAPPGKPKESD